MAADRFDFVVYGASGFTGQFVVEEVSRVAEKENIAWAIAGRNKQKLTAVLKEVSKKTGQNLDEVCIIIADSSDEKSLGSMCKKAKVVLNCVGPYRFYGEPVVQACIENGSSYVDISGEPQFLETMQLKYDQSAKNADVYVVGACGFDSIPADMGIIFMKKNIEGDLNSVENYLEICPGPEGAGINYGTYHSFIYGLAYWKELAPLRRKLYPTPLPKYKHRLKKRPAVFYSEEVGKYCISNSFADKPVVFRTQRYEHDARKHRPVQFQPYSAIPNLLTLVGMMFFGIVFLVLTMFKFGRNLLEKYPRLFSAGLVSKEGPTMKQIETTTFRMLFVGKGYSKKLDLAKEHDEEPNQTVRVLVSGPEPGYVTTPICMVQAGLVLVKESDKLPKKGGVFTPGSVFAETSLIDRLNDRQVKFQVALLQ